MKQKIYISSTFKDLKEYRSIVRSLFENQLSESFELCKIMERMWDDGSSTPFVVDCVEEVEKADIYIIILGNKVGSFPPKETRTYTEIELDSAISDTAKKLFFFRFSTFDEREIDEKDKHKELLAKFEGKPAHLFSSETELKAALLECLLPQIQVKTAFETILLSLNSPSEPEYFLGRAEELIKITERLKQRGKLMLINAEGGIGKTTLAVKFLHESLSQYKYAAWCFCENGITKALIDLAPKLQVDLRAYITESEQLNAIKRGLHDIQHDFLLVLDNANDEDDILNFKKEFAGFHWHVLMTSRCQGVLGAENELPIYHLPPDLAQDLFYEYYEMERDATSDVKVDLILKALDYHTLAIEVFAKNLHEAKGILSIDEFLEKLENQGLYLHDDSFEIKTDYAEQHLSSRKAKTDDILAALYDFSILESNVALRKLVVELAILPSNEFSLEFLFLLLTNSEKSEKIALKANLNILNKKGWITQIHDGFRMSPVVQELSRKKNEQNIVEDSQSLIERITKNLQNNGMEFESPLDELAHYCNFYENFFKNIKPVYDHASYYTYCCALFFRITCNYSNYKRCIELYLLQCIKLFEIYPNILSYQNNIAIAYEHLGNYFEIIGDAPNSILNFEKYVDISYTLTHNYPDILDYKYNYAISKSRLAKHYFHYDNFEKAEENYIFYYTTIKELFEMEPTNSKYEHSLAIAYSYLGKLAEERGKQTAAFDCYILQLNIFDKLIANEPAVRNHLAGKCVALQNIGSVLYNSGNYKKAKEFYLQYNSIAQKIVSENPLNIEYAKGLATSYLNLAQVNFQIALIFEAFENLILGHETYLQLNESTEWKSVDYSYNFAGTCKLFFDEYKKVRNKLKHKPKDNIVHFLDSKGYNTAEIDIIKAKGDAIYKVLESRNLISPFLLKKNETNL